MPTLHRRALTLLATVLLLAGSAPLHAAYPGINRHAEFNGSSYLSISNAASLNGTLAQNGGLSIDAWINPSSYNNYPTIVGNTWNTGYWLGLNPAGQLRFYPGSSTLYESIGSVPLNQWTHVAVTFSDKNNEVQFFINGALDRTISGVTTSLGTSNMDLRIGADRQGASASYFFEGGIDEVRIWGTPINFASAAGLLYRVPHMFAGGVYGQPLVSAWRLNGDAVDSVGANNGSVVGNVVYASGPTGAHYNRICAVFTNNGNTGHDYVSIPTHAGNTFAGSYTLELWVQTGSGGASTTYQTFLSKGSAPNNSLAYWLGVNKQNGKLRYVPTGNWANALESSDPLPAGQWVHVAATYTYGGNTGTARVFFNGVLKGSAVFNGAAPFSQASLLVGTSDQQLPPAQAYAFAGRLDEVRLWNIARSETDIANCHRLEIDGAISGLSGSYHFDGDVFDHSTASNHGLNNNAASSGFYFRDATDLPALPSLAVNAPNGGEHWTIGSTRSITWTANGLGAVTIELSRDGGATFGETLATGLAAATGAFSWKVTGPEAQAARIRVRSGSTPDLIDSSNADFSIDAPPPVISVAPASLSFNAGQMGPIPSSQSLDLSNIGAGTLSWNATWSSAWLDVTPSGDNGNSAKLQVRVTSTVLSAGVYRDTIRFAGNASNMPFAVPVSYTIVSTPHLAAEPAALQFATQPFVNPPSQHVHLRNAGTGVLAWTAASNTPWISVVPVTGGTDDSVEVTINVASLSPGPHTGGLTITGNADNVPFIIPVQLLISNTLYYPISGRVEAGGVPLANVAVQVSGDSALPLLTGSDGTFSVAGLRNGNYTVAASSAMYAFSPLSHSIVALSSPRSDLNFAAVPKSGSAVLKYSAGWNLISLPVDPPNGSIATLLPDANPPKAWRYAPDTGYVEVNALVFGVGYWIKFNRSDSVRIDGALRGDLHLALTGKGGGWNLVGAASGAIDIASIRQTPSDALMNVFEFVPGKGYRLPDANRMQPGRGYFIQVRGDAGLGLLSPAFAPPPREMLVR